MVKDAEVEGIDHDVLSDITYLATKEGWLWLCMMIDLHSRKIVCWSICKNTKLDLVIEAFKVAVKNQQQNSSRIIFHSAMGGQYKSKKFPLKKSSSHMGLTCKAGTLTVALESGK